MRALPTGTRPSGSRRARTLEHAMFWSSSTPKRRRSEGIGLRRPVRDGAVAASETPHLRRTSLAARRCRAPSLLHLVLDDSPQDPEHLLGMHAPSPSPDVGPHPGRAGSCWAAHVRRPDGRHPALRWLGQPPARVSSYAPRAARHLLDRMSKTSKHESRGRAPRPVEAFRSTGAGSLRLHLRPATTLPRWHARSRRCAALQRSLWARSLLARRRPRRRKDLAALPPGPSAFRLS